MTKPDLPAVWVGPAIPGVRDCDGTYCETPLQDLPAVNAPDNLTWLRPLHPTIDAEMKQYRPNANERQTYAKKARAILAQAEAQRITLPKAFVELILSESLQDRFPSATACYFDLPDKIAPAPFGLGGNIIRFLNDQQICVLWYVHLPAQGTPRVLVSYPVEGADFLEELDSQDPSVASPAIEVTRVAALSLSEFLYRYWIENSVWLKRSNGIELTPEEAEYMNAARSALGEKRT